MHTGRLVSRVGKENSKHLSALCSALAVQTQANQRCPWVRGEGWGMRAAVVRFLPFSFLLFGFPRQGFPVWPWLSWKSLCTSGWPWSQTERSACLYLLVLDQKICAALASPPCLRSHLKRRSVHRTKLPCSLRSTFKQFEWKQLHYTSAASGVSELTLKSSNSKNVIGKPKIQCKTQTT